MAPPDPRRNPALRIVALVLTLMIAATACNDSDTGPLGPGVTRPPAEGTPRTTFLGLGAVGAEGGRDAYARAFELAARSADVVMIQRAPPWTEFMEGGRISQATEDLTRFEQALIEQYDLEVFFVIDPTDPAVERSRLIDVPDQADFSDGFANDELRTALTAYAAYVARNYRPAYLAIGSEIDMYADRRPAQFERFLQAYDEAYLVAKAASPGSLVFPTFQLEDIEGNFGPTHPPRWDLLLSFSGRMDALAVTTYPYLTNIPAARSLRPDYYSQLEGYFDGPIIIAAAGYTSVPVAGSATPGTEEDQLAFLERLRDDAERTGFELVVWLSPFDPPVSPTGAGANLRGIGLLTSEAAPKLSWSLWQEWALRPHEERSP